MRFRSLACGFIRLQKSGLVTKEQEHCLIDHEEPYAWFMSIWLREAKFELDDISSLLFLPISEDHQLDSIVEDRRYLLPVRTNSEETKHIDKGEAAFEFLDLILERGAKLLSKELNCDITSFLEGISAFKTEGRIMTRVLASRSVSRGRRIRIEAHMGYEGLVAYVIATNQGEVTYKEKIMQTSPSTIFLRRSLSKINISDGIVSIENTVPTAIPRDELDQNTRFQVRTREPSGKIHYYNWSREIAELGPC